MACKLKRWSERIQESMCQPSELLVNMRGVRKGEAMFGLLSLLSAMALHMLIGDISPGFQVLSARDCTTHLNLIRNGHLVD